MFPGSKSNNSDLFSCLIVIYAIVTFNFLYFSLLNVMFLYNKFPSVLYAFWGMHNV